MLLHMRFNCITHEGKKRTWHFTFLYLLHINNTVNYKQEM